MICMGMRIMYCCGAIGIARVLCLDLCPRLLVSLSVSAFGSVFVSLFVAAFVFVSGCMDIHACVFPVRARVCIMCCVRPCRCRCLLSGLGSGSGSVSASAVCLCPFPVSMCCHIHVPGCVVRRRPVGGSKKGDGSQSRTFAIRADVGQRWCSVECSSCNQMLMQPTVHFLCVPVPAECCMFSALLYTAGAGRVQHPVVQVILRVSFRYTVTHRPQTSIPTGVLTARNISVAPGRAQDLSSAARKQRQHEWGDVPLQTYADPSVAIALSSGTHATAFAFCSCPFVEASRL